VAPGVVEDILTRISGAGSLDRVAKPVAKAVTKAVAGRPLKDLLSGTWLGHPLHAMLTDVPIGSWTSAFVLDVAGGERARPAAKTLVGVGVVTALPTAASGLSDWSDLLGGERRVGLVHAAANTVAVGFYSLSWLARRKGRYGAGLWWGFAGAGVATLGGFLGGHLSYRQGVNVDRNAWTEGPDDWQAVADDADLAEGSATRVSAGEMDILLVKSGGRIRAIADVCSHAGGPLHEGDLDLDAGCVTCPWHASVFRLDDGAAVHGPATAPQPAFDVMVDDSGKVSVRAREAG
jgi:nitrite reductase/ring-hydroxylating ferredoxin subunit/uncharacterized membrane protein